MTISVQPRDLWPPAAITDLNATPGAEGQMLLDWTAPLEDSGISDPSLNPVYSYEIRMASFSVAQSGSTTAWWSEATSIAGPTPLGPGSPQSLLLSNLEPGNTFYFAIKSADDSGNVSPIDVKAASPANQAFALVYDAIPPAPINLSTTAVGNTQINLAWTAPSAPDLDFYRIYVDSTSPYDFGNAYVLSVDSTVTTFNHTGLSQGTRYSYYVTVVDKGAPSFAGAPLESAASNVVSTATTISTKLPMAPIGVRISTTALTWLPVRSYEDHSLFADPSSPSIDELTGYRVYGATAPYSAAWTPMSATISTDTLSWAVDLSTSYYYVRAVNTTGLSRPSIVRRLDPPEAYLVSADGRSHYTLPSACADALAGTTVDDAYLIEVSSNPAELVGRVVKSVVFMAWKGGVTAVPNFTFDCMGRLRLRYEKSSSGAVQLSGAQTEAAMPEQLSVFWNNGSKWVQLYGVLDSLEQTVTVEAKYLGKYQLRAVERVGGFNFNAANLSNRMLTPNGDGKNDTVVFTFDNPQVSEVKGRLFDLKGAEVATMVPGPVSNSLMWDGKAGGNVVPGGVYIYQLEAEGKTFNGTVVVIK